MANEQRIIVPARAEHIPQIAANPGPIEEYECVTLDGHTVREALERGIQRSRRAWTGIHRGVPVVMFGVAPMTVTSEVGIPWALSARGLADVPMSTMRRAAPYVRGMQGEFRELINWVPADAVSTIRWVRWLGFSIGPPIPIGPNGELFRAFRWVRETAQAGEPAMMEES